MKFASIFVLVTALSSLTSAQETYEPPPVVEHPTLAPAGEASPIAITERSLTLPAGTLRIDAGIGMTHLSLGGLFGSATLLGIDAGLAFGILDDLEVGAKLLPLAFVVDPGSEFEFGDVTLNGMFRLASGSVEAALRLDFMLPTGDTLDRFVLFVGVPIAIHLGGLRLDTGAQFAMVFDEFFAGMFGPGLLGIFGGVSTHPAATRSSAGVPLILTFNATDNLYAGLRTGFFIVDFEDVSDTFGIPIGVQGGYTLAGAAGPLADLTVGFEFPQFYMSGNAGFSDSHIVTELWTLSFSAEIYLDLM